MSTVCINDIEKESELSDLLITRMSALRYSDYVDKADVVISFSYIFYFSLAGGLVIICSLFNYLTLFISRLCMRNREMALRKVNGASNKALSVQFAIELLLLLCIALIGGLLLVEMSMSRFLNFTQIESSSYYAGNDQRKCCYCPSVLISQNRYYRTVDCQSCFYLLHSCHHEATTFPEKYGFRYGTSSCG